MTGALMPVSSEWLNAANCRSARASAPLVLAVDATSCRVGASGSVGYVAAMSSLHAVRTLGLWLGIALCALGCGNEEPKVVADEFVIPLEKASLDGELTARLIEASPSPPAKGANNWSIELVDAAGEPVEANDFEIRLFMPEHGHPGARPTITDGDYEGEINARLGFSMGGVWEVRLYRDGTAADQDVVFYVNVAD